MIFESNATGKKIEILLPEGKTPIISLSGGADSTLLLYLVGVSNPGTLVDVVCCDVTYKGGNAQRVKDIVDKVEDMLGYKVVRDITVLPVRDNERLTNILREYMVESSTDEKVYITGITKAPPKDAVVVSEMDEVSVNPHDTCDEAYRIFNGAKPVHSVVSFPAISEDEVNLYTPMINIDKVTVYALYNELEILELYDMTRSCESGNEIETNNFKDTCNKSDDWWCMERQWSEEEYKRLT